MQSGKNCTIASQVYEDKAIWAAARKMATHKMTASDLMAELSLVLLEYNPDKLQEKRASHYWKFFVIRLLINLSNGKVAKRYNGSEFSTEQECPELTEIEQADLLTLCEQALSELPERDWVDREIFLAYLRHGSIQATVQATQIPKRTIMYSVREVRQYLKSKVKEKL